MADFAEKDLQEKTFYASSLRCDKQQAVLYGTLQHNATLYFPANEPYT